jgi:D-3-phosphoglycerate dehydrogenase
MAEDRPTALATAPLRGPGLDQLRQMAEVVLDPWIDHVPIRLYSAEELAGRVDQTGASVLICEADDCSGPVFDRPLAVVASTRGDPTNVDVDAATAAGIPVVHAPGRNADAVAELTVALLLAVTRHLIPADRDMRTRQVFGETLPYQRHRAWEVAGQTAGIIGLGAIGRAVKWRLEGLGLTVIAHDPGVDDATHDLDDLLAEADVVTMHAAVTPETVGLMDEARFAAMKPGAVYLNAARAGLHDGDALVAALASGHLSGAGLDHVDGEVLPEGHPLLTMDQVVLTPHIGGATYDTEANHTALVVDDIAAVLAGRRPQRIANPDVLD